MIAPIHRAKIVTKWKLENNIESLPWVPYSPDINVIEHVWSYLKHSLSKLKKIPSNKNELKNLTVEIYESITTSFIRNLIKSMPKICQNIIDVNGAPTKY